MLTLLLFFNVLKQILQTLLADLCVSYQFLVELLFFETTADTAVPIIFGVCHWFCGPVFMDTAWQKLCIHSY